jgi:hypothetical protein
VGRLDGVGAHAGGFTGGSTRVRGGFDWAEDAFETELEATERRERGERDDG